MNKLKLLILILSCLFVKASSFENLCIEFLNSHHKEYGIDVYVDKHNVVYEMQCLFPLNSRADYLNTLESLVFMIQDYKILPLQSKQKSAPPPETPREIILVLLEQYR